MRAWLSLLFMWLLRTIPAQDPTLVHELQAALRREQADTARVQTLARLCYNLTNSDPDSALYYGEQALGLALRINDAKGIADAHNNLGYLAINQGRLNEAAARLDSALRLFTRIGKPSYLAVVRSNMGWLAERKGDRVGMLREFQEALKHAEAAQDTGHIAVILYNIGTTYNKMEEFDRARDMLERALALERTLERPEKQAICLMSIGNTYRSQGNAQRAKDYYARSGPIFERIGDHIGAGLNAENIGGLYEAEDPREALRYYRQAMREYQAMHSGGDMAYILLSIGSMQRALGQFGQADSSFRAGALLAAAHSGAELLMDYEKQSAELASARGDAEGTLAHYERYVTMKDSVRNAGSENELMRLRAEFETEQAEKDNELLRLKDLENTERLRARNLQLYGSLALAVLALGAVVLVLRNLRQRRKHQAVLEGLNMELRDQKARIEEINGLLKLKVLRTQMDPHFIHNCLNAIRALSLKGEHERAEEYLEGFARLLRNVLEHSVRDRISLDEEIAFLEDYVRLEQLRLGEDFTWSIAADEALVNEEPQVPSLLVQPFVENAIWHGLAPKQGAKRLHVRFFVDEGAVTCRVEDNGVGRTQKAATPGRTSLGLKLTGERLELLTERMRNQGGFLVEDLKGTEGEAAGTSILLRMS
jgi:two-component system, LytTR family, sensor kinase